MPFRRERPLCSRILRFCASGGAAPIPSADFAAALLSTHSLANEAAHPSSGGPCKPLERAKGAARRLLRIHLRQPLHSTIHASEPIGGCRK